MVLALAPCLLLALRGGILVPLKSTQFITARTAGFVSAADGDGGDCIFDADSWRAAANWDPLNSFERSKLLRALLDGDLDVRECNHAAWRGLGYTLGADGSLCDADGEPVPPDVPLPNVMCDDAWLAKLQSKLPDAESGSLELCEMMYHCYNDGVGFPGDHNQQLERRGYFIVDKAYSAPGAPMVLINMPDGRVAKPTSAAPAPKKK